MELLQCNCSFLRSATRALSLAYDEVLRPSGLRITQFSMLARASAVGEMSLSELADLMAMDRTTLGRNLQPLEREGLVQINVGQDRRERLVSVTPAGRKVLARAMPLWESVHLRFEQKLGKHESKELRQTLKRIVNVGRELSAENETVMG
ncbi:MarR family winged helix-turn-helix transcriptional regulator [Paraburkholderia phenoliruptrix]|uniref:Regulatory protein MarR n=1 Tax=Burkholderia sp. (strain CCGE1003) TaxID=640512 RepID=E1T9N7_BURSG|nr:MarR family winged helix-turn-helix transcriptional regulator [Paraburkholderia phenoliruptrix]MBW0450941.1 winged helix-turn-helix transcriptional regulator [Paraburkholderia phenoliruptrix]MBW9096554.1 winged helix-turn-helix transcriptional regulator [Paraburkholderia phenoliruptrix]